MDHRVIIVEDEKGILDTICEALEMEGYEATCLEHPLDAERHASAVPPDLFIIDLMLPGMDGIALTQRLRARGFTETPMIAMSASGDMVRRARQSGLFQDAIAKPFDLGDMLDRVERFTSP